MFKAIGTTHTCTRVIYLGLTPALMRDLCNGQPIRVRGDSLGIAAEIVIFAGNVDKLSDDKLRALTIVSLPISESGLSELADRTND